MQEIEANSAASSPAEAGADVGLIRTRLSPPRLPAPMLSRPRLTAEIGELIERSPIVWVCASAGSGKTAAVLEATAECDRPLAWLTVDGSDVAPGRLVTYLETALAGIAPELGGVGTQALAAGAPHVEATGLLIDAVGDATGLLVLDEIERLADSPQALAVIGAVLRYAPAELRTVLISRREVELDVGSTDRLSRIAAIGESDLAFTVEEAAAALELVGRSEVDAADAVDATGGWVTGVLFEAWRSQGHRFGTGGQADPLHGYLGSQIVSRLPADLRDLLVRASVLEEVSAASVAALGEPDAAERLAALRQHRLPGSWSLDGSRFRANVRFREYLAACLLQRPESEVRATRLAHGQLLAEAGRWEEATEEFLLAGAVPLAAETAERAVFGVVSRGDFDVAERWIRSFGEATVGRSRPLTAAELMTANAREDYRHGQRVADRLVALYRDAGEPLPGEIYGLVGWCYFLVGRLDDDAAARALSQPSPEADLLSHASGLETGAAGVRYADTPASFGCDLDGILRRVHLAHGRIDLALEPARTPWQQAVHKPWQIEALVAAGRLDEALCLYEEVKAGGWTGSFLDGYVAIQLLAATGRHEEAFEALIESREQVVRSGSSFYQMLHLLTEAELALRINRDTRTARAALDRVRRQPGSERFLRVRAQLLVWDGMRMLLEDRDEAAHDSLRAAVELLSAHERLLSLPTAAVYLAEAAWRCGEEEAADDAADLALATSRTLGTNQMLLTALRDFPAVLARRIDAEPGPDTAWHAIGRALGEDGDAAHPVHAPVRLHDLGELRVEIGEEAVAPRLRKSLELLAYLALCPGGRAGRDELLGALFVGRDSDSSRAYLRQALARLRHVMPDGTISREDDGSLVLAPGVVVSDAAELQGRIREAHGLSDRARRRRLSELLSAAGRAEYLVDVEGEWVSWRREELQGSVCQAQIDLAQLAFDDGDYSDAERLASAALEADPFRESAWRLLMRVRSILGDDDGVISVYRACVDALRGGGVAPANATSDLLTSLRR